MKITFLHILLFSSLVFSQQKIPNLTSITLHKIYNEPDDGSCNSFIDKQNADVLSWKISDCDKLVLELIKLKHILKNRKSKVCSCQSGCIGCPSIEYMITYQFNKLVDTIYFNNNKYEKVVIDYKNKKEYPDSSNEILKIITKSKRLNELFKTDIDKIYRDTFISVTLDSINVEQLKINGRNLYGLTKKAIDSLVGGFRDLESEISLDKTTTDRHKYYKPNKDSYNEYYFSDDYPIDKIVISKIEEEGNTYPDDDLFNLNGIQLDENEERLSKRFPISTKQIENQKKYFKDENGDYTLSVKILDNKGYIHFIFNNAKIKQIEIYFRYPKTSQ